ncbi:MAG: hypothetical protein K9L17_13565 [Clostridiales bacterium]|nr:hypothetical protein [Clostridiales bacterium]MCF8023700.1 hypothetical protein [Clostridiales bacterium]
MAVNKLVEEIRKLSRKQKTELFYKLGLKLNQDLENSEQLLDRSPGTSGKDLLKFAGRIDKLDLDNSVVS